MGEQWLSIVEYARNFAVSDMTVRRRIKTGKLKAVLKDGKYYIPTSSVPEKANIVGSHAPLSSENSSEIKRDTPFANELHARSAAVTLGQKNNGATRSYEVPELLKRPLGQEPISQVETKALLDYCNRSLNQLEKHELALEEKFSTHIKSLESKITHLQSEIVRYKQQVEDLQLLVKVFEQKA